MTQNVLTDSAQHKIDRCLARYSPHAEANNGTMQYHAIPIRYKAILDPIESGPSESEKMGVS